MVAYTFPLGTVNLKKLARLVHVAYGTLNLVPTVKEDGSAGVSRIEIIVPDSVTRATAMGWVATATGVADSALALDEKMSLVQMTHEDVLALVIRLSTNFLSLPLGTRLMAQAAIDAKSNEIATALS